MFCWGNWEPLIVLVYFCPTRAMFWKNIHAKVVIWGNCKRTTLTDYIKYLIYVMNDDINCYLGWYSLNVKSITEIYGSIHAGHRYLSLIQMGSILKVF